MRTEKITFKGHSGEALAARLGFARWYAKSHRHIRPLFHLHKRHPHRAAFGASPRQFRHGGSAVLISRGWAARRGILPIPPSPLM